MSESETRSQSITQPYDSKALASLKCLSCVSAFNAFLVMLVFNRGTTPLLFIFYIIRLSFPSVPLAKVCVFMK